MGVHPSIPAAVLKDSGQKQFRRVDFDLKSRGLGVNNGGDPVAER